MKIFFIIVASYLLTVFISYLLFRAVYKIAEKTDSAKNLPHLLTLLFIVTPFLNLIWSLGIIIVEYIDYKEEIGKEFNYKKFFKL